MMIMAKSMRLRDNAADWTYISAHLQSMKIALGRKRDHFHHFQIVFPFLCGFHALLDSQEPPGAAACLCLRQGVSAFKLSLVRQQHLRNAKRSSELFTNDWLH